MVFIDLEVAATRHRQSQTAMTGKLLEHVIEKTDPGTDFGMAAAIQVYRQMDPRFFGLAAHLGTPC